MLDVLMGRAQGCSCTNAMRSLIHLLPLRPPRKCLLQIFLAQPRHRVRRLNLIPGQVRPRILLRRRVQHRRQHQAQRPCRVRHQAQHRRPCRVRRRHQRRARHQVQRQPRRRVQRQHPLLFQRRVRAPHRLRLLEGQERRLSTRHRGQLLLWGSVILVEFS